MAQLQVLSEIQELAKREGVYIVISSRARIMDMENALMVQINHLSTEAIKARLGKQLYDKLDPKEDKSLMDLLSNPMMLECYLKINQQEDRMSRLGAGTRRVDLLQAYLQMSLETEIENKKEESSYLRFIYLMVIPAIAHYMEKHRLFSISPEDMRPLLERQILEDLKSRLREDRNEDEPERFLIRTWKELLGISLGEFYQLRKKILADDGYTILDTLVNKCQLLVYSENCYHFGSAFYHQIFRDFFSALYIRNQLCDRPLASVLKERRLPPPLREQIGQLFREDTKLEGWVKNDSREMFCEGELCAILNNLGFPEDHFPPEASDSEKKRITREYKLVVRGILDILRTVRKGLHAIRFTNLDLSAYSFNRMLLSGHVNGQYYTSQFDNCRLFRETFQPQGHMRTIRCLAQMDDKDSKDAKDEKEAKDEKDKKDRKPGLLVSGGRDGVIYFWDTNFRFCKRFCEVGPDEITTLCTLGRRVFIGTNATRLGGQIFVYDLTEQKEQLATQHVAQPGENKLPELKMDETGWKAVVQFIRKTLGQDDAALATGQGNIPKVSELGNKLQGPEGARTSESEESRPERLDTRKDRKRRLDSSDDVAQARRRPKVGSTLAGIASKSGGQPVEASGNKASTESSVVAMRAFDEEGSTRLVIVFSRIIVRGTLCVDDDKDSQEKYRFTLEKVLYVGETPITAADIAPEGKNVLFCIGRTAFEYSFEEKKLFCPHVAGNACPGDICDIRYGQGGRILLVWPKSLEIWKPDKTPEKTPEKDGSLTIQEVCEGKGQSIERAVPLNKRQYQQECRRTPEELSLGGCDFRFARFSPDGLTVVFVDANNRIWSYDWRNRELNYLGAHDRSVRDVIFSKHYPTEKRRNSDPGSQTGLVEKWLYSCSEDGSICRWAPQTSDYCHISHGSFYRFNRMCMDGDTLIFPSSDWTIKRAHLGSDSIQFVDFHEGHIKGVNAVAFLEQSPKKLLLSCSTDGTVILWDITGETWVRLARSEKDVSAQILEDIAVIDSKHFATITATGEVTLWTVEQTKSTKTEPERYSLKSSPVQSPGFDDREIGSACRIEFFPNFNGVDLLVAHQPNMRMQFWRILGRETKALKTVPLGVPTFSQDDLQDNNLHHLARFTHEKRDYLLVALRRGQLYRFDIRMKPQKTAKRKWFQSAQDHEPTFEKCLIKLRIAAHDYEEMHIYQLVVHGSDLFLGVFLSGKKKVHTVVRFSLDALKKSRGSGDTSPDGTLFARCFDLICQHKPQGRVVAMMFHGNRLVTFAEDGFIRVLDYTSRPYKVRRSPEFSPGILVFPNDAEGLLKDAHCMVFKPEARKKEPTNFLEHIQTASYAHLLGIGGK